MGNGIDPEAAGISVQYRSVLITNWVPFFRYRTGSGIGIFVSSGAGLTGFRTFKTIYEGRKRYIMHVQTADGGKGYTLTSMTPYTAASAAKLAILCLKSEEKSGMPGKM
jgi:hypothetical protein